MSLTTTPDQPQQTSKTPVRRTLPVSEWLCLVDSTILVVDVSLIRSFAGLDRWLYVVEMSNERLVGYHVHKVQNDAVTFDRFIMKPDVEKQLIVDKAINYFAPSFAKTFALSTIKNLQKSSD